MKLGFTEFSFGYAFTENLIRSAATSPHGAPIFPNLVQEARLGFDVHIDLPGLPLFFQYKLPELMKRKSAAEISKFNLSGLSVPFFRMPLMRRDISQQHQQLIKLEQIYPGTVFYASPCLRNRQEFDRAYCSTSVHKQSVFFSPNEIGPILDHKTHSVAYRKGLAVGFFCSRPREIMAKNFEAISQEAQTLLGQKRFRTLKDASLELREYIRSFATETIRESENKIEDRVRFRAKSWLDLTVPNEKERVIVDVLVAREVARIELGADLLIAQPRA
jgi:tRNA U38,U39,U40 pseudouridine synthase TruA